MTLNECRLPALLLAALLGGCASRLPPVKVEPASPTDLANREVLDYQQKLQDFSPAEREQELRRLSSAAATPANSLSLALLLARSRSSADLAQAQALLDAVQRKPDAQPYQPLARLLSSLIAGLRSEQRKQEEQQGEQKKLEEQLERQGQQLRDSLKKNEQQNERLDALRGQLDALNLKLEALKAIERSLPSRPAPASNGVKP